MTQKEMMDYDQIVELGIATADELNLARNLMAGSWEQVLNAVVYVRTDYRSLDQYYAEEMDDFEE
jgi:hypothetical protein